MAAATLKAQYQSKPKSGFLHITKDKFIWWGRSSRTVWVFSRP
ncbi:MAG: hypothetical protein PHY43_07970 [Verrucomicrobiales bacterium]|nr:hypothetical protein [Verrucomicrobiales bacterium]